MSKLVRSVESFAALANGPLPKPSGMQNLVINKLKKPLIPGYLLLCGIGAITYYYAVQKPLKQARASLMLYHPDDLFEEIREYGIFKNAPASWQEE